MKGKLLARIYPDREAYQGRVAFVGDDKDSPFVGRYYVMKIGEQRPDLLEDLQQNPQYPVYVFLPLGIILYNLEGTEPLSVHQLTSLVHLFINEAQRDFPIIWQRICQTARNEAFTWIN